MARTLTVTKRQRDAALKFANQVRAAMGKRPVKRLQKGRPSKAHSCAIARTIDRNGYVAVSGDGLGAECFISHRRSPGAEALVVKTKSKLVGQFIERFDKGYAPDLEVRS